MKLNKYFILGSFLLFIGACKKELPFPNSTDAPLLVINSLFHADTFFTVHVSESCHIQDTSCVGKNIETATVHLKDESGNIISTLDHQDNGIYTSDVEIEQNTTYQIEAAALGFTNARAKGKTPKQIDCEYMGFEEGLYSQNRAWGFEVEIKDNPDEENYYILEGYFEIPNGQPSGISVDELNGYVEPHVTHYSNDINAINSSLTSGFDFVTYGLRAVYLPDENFNGQTYRTHIAMRDFNTYEVHGDNEMFAKLFIKSVSKEMYDYLVSLEKSRLSIANIGAEPEQIRSNIENGIGIFAGYTQQAFNVPLPESGYSFPGDAIVENNGCTAPCTINFSVEGGALYNYNWTFGDGNTTTGREVENLYQASGTYQVEMNYSIGPGDTGGHSFQVTVN